MLEAIAWTNTRFTHLQPDSNAESCNGMPQAYGVMGLYLDGKGYFTNTAVTLSQFSGISLQNVKTNPHFNILSVAEALYYVKGKKPEDYFSALNYISGFPHSTTGQKYAIDLWKYEVASFLTSPEKAAFYGFPVWKIDMADLFGEQNLKALSSSHVMVSEGSVITKSGIEYQPEKSTESVDYGPAVWTAAASCNYSSRNGTAVSAVTIHTVQGSYAGCISWFQNCNAQVSAHYVVRSSDGQVTQMVLESDKAWHVGNENPYTIGIEHEGYVDNPAWYTNAMYTSSANLCRDICNSGYGINPLRTYYGPACTGGSANCQLGGCIKIKGHQHFANQSHSDPGPNWDWIKFYNLINNSTPVNTLTANAGTIYDSGGANGNYADDEHTVTLINPPNTTSITLTFTQFNIENNWDYLYLYDGNSVNAPLLGTYTGTTLPGPITSSGNALLLRFRSDCATTAPGWAATYTTVPNGDYIAPTTVVNSVAAWYDSSFVAMYTDADNVGGSGLQQRFYTVAFYDSTRWSANNNNGFYRDDFESIDMWTAHTGTWGIVNASLVQSDEALANTNIYSTVKEDLANTYLYHWRGKIDGSGTNRRAGFHFMASSDTLDNHGNSYFVWFRADQDEVQIYKVANNVFSLTTSFLLPINNNQWYDYKVSFDRITGKTMVWMDNALVGTWIDTSPYTTGKYIAFRSGNCVYTIDDFEVYRSRPATTTISIAQADTTADIWRQNPSMNQPAGMVRSIVTDNAGNISAIDNKAVNVAFTINWTGAVSTDWNNNLNWSPPRVPTLHTDAIIPDVSLQSGNFPVLSTGNNAVVKNLDIRVGASVTNTNGKTITVVKDLTNKGTLNAGADVFIGN
ncbi:MAG: N-acetylmuramoyl-L-alanine amidase [Sphingobacteriales bacterium JAD_PAG50586_3]|nr:MAG: N-acetylmuramoyl-L-alanine amidase [Sphingobacteriales bacterium JAD_PAG50586_3]